MNDEIIDYEYLTDLMEEHSLFNCCIAYLKMLNSLHDDNIIRVKNGTLNPTAKDKEIVRENIKKLREIKDYFENECLKP